MYITFFTEMVNDRRRSLSGINAPRHLAVKDSQGIQIIPSPAVTAEAVQFVTEKLLQCIFITGPALCTANGSYLKIQALKPDAA